MEEPDPDRPAEPAGPPPAVSVIIPTYNHRDFVAAAIESVLSQSFAGGVEVIVVNDGSPDDTADVLRPLVTAGRVRYVEQPNAGQAAARNRGIGLATGEFVALLDDDDAWPPDHLDWQVAALRAAPAAVMVYGTHHKTGQPAPEPPGGPPVQGREHFARGCPLISPGQALFRGDALRAVGGLDVSLWGTDDWDLYLRLAAVGPALCQDRLALHYRVHAANASRDFRRMFRNAMRVVDKHFPAGRSDPTVRAAAVASVRQMAAQIGIGRVIALRRQHRWFALLAELLAVLRIRPALARPDALLRRARHVVGRPPPHAPP